MRRTLKCGCDVLANRIYLCEKHQHIADELIRVDELIPPTKTLEKQTEFLMLSEGEIVDAVIIESGTEDETKHE